MTTSILTFQVNRMSTTNVVLINDSNVIERHFHLKKNIFIPKKNHVLLTDFRTKILKENQ